MIIRFIGKKPELDRYSVKYQAGGENRLHFEMPVPYNNGSEYRIFLNGADVTDGFDYSTVSYVHAPVVVKRGGQTIWTSGEIWLDVVRKEDDFGGGGAMVDATLTVQGAAADAKATGDAIGELSKEIANTVRTTAQGLTEEQKAQARANIGAMSDGVEIVTESSVFETYIKHEGIVIVPGELSYVPTTTLTNLYLTKQSTLAGGRVYIEYDANKIAGFAVRGFLFDGDNRLIGAFAANNGTANPAFGGLSSNVIGDFGTDAWLEITNKCNRIYSPAGPFSVAVPEGCTTMWEIYLTNNCTSPDGSLSLTYPDDETGRPGLYKWAKTNIVATTKVENKPRTETVLYVHQDLTEEQKAQARKNVGAVSISEVVTTIESGGKVVPDYWQGAVDEVIEAVKSKQNEGGHDCVTFAFFSDSHIGASGTGDAGHTGILCKTVMDACDIPYAIACGDNTDEMGDGSKEGITGVRTAFARTRENFAPIGWDRLLHTIGNHDGCWGNNEALADRYYCYQLDSNEMYNHVYRKHKGVAEIVFGGDCSYYYVDDAPSKTRFVVLNSHWVLDSYTEDDVAINRRMRTFGFGQEQLSWLAEKALNFDEDDWGVVIAFHAPFITEGTYRDRDVMIGILNNYIAGTSGTYTYGTSGAWDAVNVTVDYTSEAHRAEVIGVFNGHKHDDAIDTETYSFPTVRIICDSGLAGQNSSYTGVRKFGTDTEHAIDFVTINRATKNVHLTRLGAGYERSREYNYGN